MRGKSLLGTVGFISMFVWIGPGASQERQPPDRPGRPRAERRATDSAGEGPRSEDARQSPRTQLQAQIEALDVQKRQLEEQAREQMRQIEDQVADQVAQLKKDLASQVGQLQQQARRQIDQARNSAKWQGELLEAQKRVLAAEASQSRATMPGAPGFPPGPASAGPHAGGGPDPLGDTLNRLIDRLERLEKRLDRLEKK
jgi:hypothetical protein